MTIPAKTHHTSPQLTQHIAGTSNSARGRCRSPYASEFELRSPPISSGIGRLLRKYTVAFRLRGLIFHSRSKESESAQEECHRASCPEVSESGIGIGAASARRLRFFFLFQLALTTSQDAIGSFLILIAVCSVFHVRLNKNLRKDCSQVRA